MERKHLREEEEQRKRERNEELKQKIMGFFRCEKKKQKKLDTEVGNQKTGELNNDVEVDNNENS